MTMTTTRQLIPSDVRHRNRTLRNRTTDTGSSSMCRLYSVILFLVVMNLTIVTAASSVPHGGSSSPMENASRGVPPRRRRWSMLLEDVATIKLASTVTKTDQPSSSSSSKSRTGEGRNGGAADEGGSSSPPPRPAWQFWRRGGQESGERENPPTTQRPLPKETPEGDKPTSTSETARRWRWRRRGSRRRRSRNQEATEEDDKEDSSSSAATPEEEEESSKKGASDADKTDGEETAEKDEGTTSPSTEKGDGTDKEQEDGSHTETKDGEAKVDPSKSSQTEAPRFPPGIPIVYRAVPAQSMYGPGSRGSAPQHHPSSAFFSPSPGSAQSQAVAVAFIANIINLASKWLLVRWLIKKMALESEARSPVQHFMWECLNDRHVVDTQVWNRVLRRKPLSDSLFGTDGNGGSPNHSHRRWGKIVHDMTVTSEIPSTGGDDNNERLGDDDVDPAKGGDKELLIEKLKYLEEWEKKDASIRTVIVVDIGKLDADKLTDIVSFLVDTHTRDVMQHKANTVRNRNHHGRRDRNRDRQSFFHFGPSPEVVVLVESPGGEVTLYGLCAAQIGRLRRAGFTVTACVDRVAASGGYMIASQASQIVAAPFAVLGSIGVMAEGLNFHQLLKKYGILPLTFKSGDEKNVISTFGEVTPRDIQSRQDDADVTHRAFIDMCLANRPQLDPAVCNGKVLFGQRALESGMIDRIMTSEEYLMEHMATGKSLVMKLHLVSGFMSERTIFMRALEILPHLKHKMQSALETVFGGGIGARSTALALEARAPSGLQHNPRVSAEVISNVVQGVALFSMIRRAVTHHRQLQKQQQQNGVYGMNF